jgi:hypothetical protein
MKTYITIVLCTLTAFILYLLYDHITDKSIHNSPASKTVLMEPGIIMPADIDAALQSERDSVVVQSNTFHPQNGTILWTTDTLAGSWRESFPEIQKELNSLERQAKFRSKQSLDFFVEFGIRDTLLDRSFVALGKRWTELRKQQIQIEKSFINKK